MDYVQQVVNLSPDFYADYPPAQYPELMHKPGRPYNCLLVDTHEDYYICIPFRSNIGHNYAYMFRNSVRSLSNHSGLDYSKMVIVQKDRYITCANPVVDNDEYVETMQNLPRILQESTAYLEDYIKHVNGTALLHPREFVRRYACSCLPYFHAELGI